MIDNHNDVLTVSTEIACKIIGIAPRTFRDLTIQATKHKGRAAFYSLDDVLAERDKRTTKAYIATAADLVPIYDDDGDEINVEQERAKKLKAERIAQELKNAEMMGELAPIDLLLSALNDALRTANQWLESVPALIKRANPEISGTTLDKIELECSKVRNSIADGRIDYTDDRMAEFREKPRFEEV